MTVNVPPALAAFVSDEVSTGHFPSEEAVVTAALELLARRQQRLHEIRELLQPALDELDQGGGALLDAEAIKARGRARLAADGGRSLFG